MGLGVELIRCGLDTDPLSDLRRGTLHRNTYMRQIDTTQIDTRPRANGLYARTDGSCRKLRRDVSYMSGEAAQGPGGASASASASSSISPTSLLLHNTLYRKDDTITIEGADAAAVAAAAEAVVVGAAQADFDRGVMYDSTGHTLAALNHFLSALSILPRLSEAWYNAAVMLERLRSSQPTPTSSTSAADDGGSGSSGSGGSGGGSGDGDGDDKSYVPVSLPLKMFAQAARLGLGLVDLCGSGDGGDGVVGGDGACLSTESFTRYN